MLVLGSPAFVPSVLESRRREPGYYSRIEGLTEARRSSLSSKGKHWPGHQLGRLIADLGGGSRPRFGVKVLSA